jgi:hypothetical protein
MMTTLALIAALTAVLAALFVMRRWQPRVKNAPVVELATAERSRAVRIKQACTELLGGRRPIPVDDDELPAPTLETSAVQPQQAPAAPVTPLSGTQARYGAEVTDQSGRIRLADDERPLTDSTWTSETVVPVDLPVASSFDASLDAEPLPDFDDRGIPSEFHAPDAR